MIDHRAETVTLVFIGQAPVVERVGKPGIEQERMIEVLDCTVRNRASECTPSPGY